MCEFYLCVKSWEIQVYLNSFLCVLQITLIIFFSHGNAFQRPLTAYGTIKFCEKKLKEKITKNTQTDVGTVNYYKFRENILTSV